MTAGQSLQTWGPVTWLVPLSKGSCSSSSARYCLSLCTLFLPVSLADGQSNKDQHSDPDSSWSVPWQDEDTPCQIHFCCHVGHLTQQAELDTTQQ